MSQDNHHEQSLKPRPQLPATHLPGAIPTLNGRGFMLEALDSYASEFVDFAAKQDGEALDIGCAYGVATLAALKRGARVCACDMEPGHLAFLETQVSPEHAASLRTVVGLLPSVTFKYGEFVAVLASRVIHFLSGPEIRTTINAMFNWLRPGGQIYLVADTPYMPGWDTIVPDYEAAKAKGAEWPGFIADFARFREKAKDGFPGPSFLNTLDPDILRRECIIAGFEVMRASFFGLQRLGAKSNGREHAGCVAKKPK